ncbi:MAG: hypothetical protein ACJ75J_06865 [Cytophagaceae bacterium]
MKHLFLSVATTFICLCLLFTSCKKDKDVEAEPDLTSEQDHATGESDANTTQTAIDAAYTSNPGEYRMASSCGTVTIMPDSNTVNGGTGPVLANFPNGYRKFIIDFSVSHNCNDTITRTGQIVVYHYGHYASNTLYDSAVFVGYSISGRSIKGYRARKADAVNSTSTLKIFNVHAIDTITFSDGKTFTRNATRIRQDDLTGQKTTISGNASGKNRNNDSWASTTTSVVFNWNCDNARYPVSGTFAFTNVSKGTVRSIDFGLGSCDRIATFISAKGHTYTFIMR